MMQDLEVAPTRSTPAIRFSAETGRLEISGESYPENSFAFFEPVMSWVVAFLAKTDVPIRFDLHVSYMNTSSIKALVDMLDLLEQAHVAGRDVAVTWSYDEENDRALDMAEEFKDDLTLPFTMVARQATD